MHAWEALLQEFGRWVNRRPRSQVALLEERASSRPLRAACKLPSTYAHVRTCLL